jgi:hypothetical protein
VVRSSTTRVRHIQDIRRLCPGQARHPIEVRADDAVFGGGSGQLGQSIQFALCFLERFLRHPGLVNLFAKLFDLNLLLVGLAQLFLNGLELFAQKVFALDFGHLGLGLALNLFAQFQDLEFVREQGDDLAQLGAHVVQFQDFLRIGQLNADIGSDGIHQLAWVFDTGRNARQLVWHAWNQFDQPRKQFKRFALERLHLNRILLCLLDARDPGLEVRGDLRVLSCDAFQAEHDGRTVPSADAASAERQPPSRPYNIRPGPAPPVPDSCWPPAR